MTKGPDRDEASVFGGEGSSGLCFMDHPLRAELVEQVHARPFVALEPPVQVSHLALVSGEHGAAADFAQLVRLCKRFGLSPPTGGSKHFRCDFGAFLLKWERHGEFCMYTFFCPGSLEQPFSSPAILTVPRDWLETLPGKRLVAVHVAVEPDLLLAMDRRARLQSRLQRVLEVISIVALTYYLAMLLTTILKALKTAGVQLDVELITGAATPFLLGIIWLGLRWARRTVIRRHERDPY